MIYTKKNRESRCTIEKTNQNKKKVDYLFLGEWEGFLDCLFDFSINQYPKITISKKNLNQVS